MRRVSYTKWERVRLQAGTAQWLERRVMYEFAEKTVNIGGVTEADEAEAERQSVVRETFVLLYAQQARLPGFVSLLYLSQEAREARLVMQLGGSDLSDLLGIYPGRRFPEPVACYYALAMARLFDALHEPHPLDKSFLVLYDATLPNWVIHSLTGALLAIDPGIARNSADAVERGAVANFQYPPELQHHVDRYDAVFRHYMSQSGHKRHSPVPKQLLEGFALASPRVTRTSDLWSLGVSVYRMLHGVLPFTPIATYGEILIGGDEEIAADAIPYFYEAVGTDWIRCIFKSLLI